MGAEARCRGRFGGASSEGKALLETDEVVFRGEFGAKLKLATLARVEAKAGKLTLAGPEGTLILELGDAAARWAERIRNPPTLLDKLGVKPGSRVAVLGDFEKAFLADVAARAGSVATGRLPKEFDVAILMVDDAKDLARIGSVASRLPDEAALWVVHPKGRKDLRGVDVLGAGRDAGLVDNKVARFSATRSALRFVVPKARRGA